MELPDIEELMRTANIDKANKALQAGWRLITVVTPISTNGTSNQVSAGRRACV